MGAVFFMVGRPSRVNGGDRNLAEKQQPGGTPASPARAVGSQEQKGAASAERWGGNMQRRRCCGWPDRRWRVRLSRYRGQADGPLRQRACRHGSGGDGPTQKRHHARVKHISLRFCGQARTGERGKRRKAATGGRPRGGKNPPGRPGDGGWRARPCECRGRKELSRQSRGPTAHEDATPRRAHAGWFRGRREKRQQHGRQQGCYSCHSRPCACSSWVEAS